MIFWQNLIKSEKFEFAFFASMYVFHIDFSIVFSFAHFVDIFYKFFTVKLHRYRVIDVAKNIWKFWNSQWCYQNHDVIRTFVNIAKFKQLILVSWRIFWSILNIKSHIDALFHENAYSERRNFSNARSHVLHFDFTLYLKSLDYRISIRSFLQFSHRCMIQNISRWKSLFENFKQYVVKKVTSLKKFENSSSKKFARKFQIEFVKILSKKHKRLLWKNVENTVFANVFDKCCN